MDTQKKEAKVSARLRKLRIERELSQAALAQKAGIDRKTVNRIENGHYSPSLQSLILLCSVLKVRPADVLEGI
jgi:DNA-binding XRE family transcriptional regulator